MSICINEAKKGMLFWYKPFGACIVRDGVVISSSNNQVSSFNDITSHAEIETIRQACKSLNTLLLKECTLYTTCEPCIMCLGASFWSGVEKIYFWVDIHTALNSWFRQFNLPSSEAIKIAQANIEIRGWLLIEENKKLFTDWETYKFNH